MARVAANQDASEGERNRYVYVQHTKMTSRKGNRVMCEEFTDYRVTPSASSSHFELVKLEGTLWNKGRYVHYSRLQPDNADVDAAKSQNKGTNEQSTKNKKNQNSDEGNHDSIDIGDDGMDRDLVENMRKNLLYSNSKDGIDANLFPLTSKAQAEYIFSMVGREHLNGRDVYHIVFRPRDKSDFAWKGDAYIDESSCQPVLVTTGLSRKIPFGVRVLLGTDVPGVGFTVVYAPQPDGVWFPTSLSTEFKIHVLYFFHRQILLDAQNREFQKTHSETKILDSFTPVENR